MKVYQLFEDANDPQLYPWLWENCAPFLEELMIHPKDGLRDVYDKANMLRGMENADKVGEEKNFQTSWGDEAHGRILPVRKNRAPRDTHPDLADVIDDMLEQKFGWRPRESSIFCTGALSVARAYGKIYRVFPIGQFKYVWSKEIRDITRKIPILLANVGAMSKDVDEDYPKEVLADFYETLSDNFEGSFLDHDLLGAIQSKNEIMVSCDKYLIIPLHN